jgi:hypothetical protein
LKLLKVVAERRENMKYTLITEIRLISSIVSGSDVPENPSKPPEITKEATFLVMPPKT